jgi:hypothetical protein
VISTRGAACATPAPGTAGMSGRIQALSARISARVIMRRRCAFSAARAPCTR